MKMKQAALREAGADSSGACMGVVSGSAAAQGSGRPKVSATGGHLGRTVHPSVERALDLISTTRSPAQLLKASRGAWNEHGYPLTYACFTVLVAFTDRFGDQGDGDVSEEVAIPRPPSEVIILAGRRRGEELLDMLGDLFTRVHQTAPEQTQELAAGPSLEDLDKHYKGNAAYLMAYIVGSGLETLVEQGEGADGVLDSVTQFLEQLSS